MMTKAHWLGKSTFSKQDSQHKNVNTGGKHPQINGAAVAASQCSLHSGAADGTWHELQVVKYSTILHLSHI